MAISLRGTRVAAMRLHSQLVSAVLDALLSWFNPVGRVTNCLSRDMGSRIRISPNRYSGYVILGAVTSIILVFIVPTADLLALGAVYQLP